MKIDAEGPPTAWITITVLEFHKIGCGEGCTKAKFALTGNKDVSQEEQEDGSTTFDVKRQFHLEFAVKPEHGDPHTYTPVGIGFAERPIVGAEVADANCGKEFVPSDPLGRAAFPCRTTASTPPPARLCVFDANPARADFEFSLIIQRSDGELGVVDPKIRNRPS